MPSSGCGSGGPPPFAHGERGGGQVDQARPEEPFVPRIDIQQHRRNRQPDDAPARADAAGQREPDEIPRIMRADRHRHRGGQDRRIAADAPCIGARVRAGETRSRWRARRGKRARWRRRPSPSPASPSPPVRSRRAARCRCPGSDPRHRNNPAGSPGHASRRRCRASTARRSKRVPPAACARARRCGPLGRHSAGATAAGRNFTNTAAPSATPAQASRRCARSSSATASSPIAIASTWPLPANSQTASGFQA